MFNRYLTYYRIPVQLLSFALVFLLCLLLLSVINFLMVPQLMDGMSYKSFSEAENYSDATFIQTHRILQLIAQLFIFVIPAGIFSYLAYPNPDQYLKLKNSINWRHLLLASLIMICSIPFINLLEYFNNLMPLTPGMMELEKTASQVTKAFLQTSNTGHLILNVLIFVIIAAVGEELFFRGVLQNILISTTFKNRPYLAIMITALIFSLFHGEMSGLLPRAYAGFLIGLAYYFSNTIWVPILMHAINNGFALLTFYIIPTQFENPIGTLDYKDLLEIIPLTILSLYLFYLFYKKRNEYTLEQVEIDPDETNYLANTNNYE